jgi:IS5 family transposase
MAGRTALHVWIDSDLYTLLHDRHLREQRYLREVVEETLLLGQSLYQAQQQEEATTHLLAHALTPLETELRHLLTTQQANHVTLENLADLLLVALREAYLARKLSYASLEYFLGTPGAQAHYDRAQRQVGELLTPHGQAVGDTP